MSAVRAHTTTGERQCGVDVQRLCLDRRADAAPGCVPRRMLRLSASVSSCRLPCMCAVPSAPCCLDRVPCAVLVCPSLHPIACSLSLSRSLCLPHPSHAHALLHYAQTCTHAHTKTEDEEAEVPAPATSHVDGILDQQVEVLLLGKPLPLFAPKAQGTCLTTRSACCIPPQRVLLDALG